jgi:hypothetical protein
LLEIIEYPADAITAISGTPKAKKRNDGLLSADTIS